MTREIARPCEPSIRLVPAAQGTGYFFRLILVPILIFLLPSHLDAPVTSGEEGWRHEAPGRLRRGACADAAQEVDYDHGRGVSAATHRGRDGGCRRSPSVAIVRRSAACTRLIEAAAGSMLQRRLVG